MIYSPKLIARATFDEVGMYRLVCTAEIDVLSERGTYQIPMTRTFFVKSMYSGDFVKKVKQINSQSDLICISQSDPLSTSF